MVDPRNIEVVDDAMAAVLRTKSGGERLRIASGMYAMARKLIIGHLRAAHPDWDDRRIVREAARRLSQGMVR